MTATRDLDINDKKVLEELELVLGGKLSLGGFRGGAYLITDGRITSLDFSLAYKMNPVPESIGLLTELQYLDLQCNDIVEIPQSIGQLKKLKDLCLHTNKITQLPDSIGDLESLETLYVTRNKLTKLPETIYHM